MTMPDQAPQTTQGDDEQPWQVEVIIDPSALEFYLEAVLPHEPKRLREHIAKTIRAGAEAELSKQREQAQRELLDELESEAVDIPPNGSKVVYLAAIHAKRLNLTKNKGE